MLANTREELFRPVSRDTSCAWDDSRWCSAVADTREERFRPVTGIPAIPG